MKCRVQLAGVPSLPLSAFRAARRINLSTRRGLLNDRHEASALAGRAYLLDYF